ncbi:MAG: PH domain-containing protein [Bryobacterales bacterium]|nr:PH domain-containing protein [Bryobacterales bacterium]
MEPASIRDPAGPYTTKVDRWLGAISAMYVLLAIGLPAWLLGSAVGSSQPLDPGLVALPLGVLAAMWAIAYPCEYLFEASDLVVRSGLLCIRIPLLSISTVKPSRSLASAPAWSFDRLEIRYGRKQRVLISPREKAAFLAELAKRAPQLIRDGESLVVAQSWKTPEENGAS